MARCPSCGDPASSVLLAFRSTWRCSACGSTSRVSSLPMSWTAAAICLGAGSATVMQPEPWWLRVVLAAVVSTCAVTTFCASRCELVSDDARATT